MNSQEIIQDLKKKENSLKIINDILGNKIKEYQGLKTIDDGSHKNHWKQIDFARKEVDVLRRNKLYLVRQITLLEKKLNQLISQSGFSPQKLVS